MEVRRRLGPPEADRRAAGGRWMVHELPGTGVLRLRFSPRLSSWTLTFDEPLPPDLRAAARAVGLWPELGPEPERPPDPGEGPLVRRSLRHREGRPVSATAALGPGGVKRIAVFDEEPEW